MRLECGPEWYKLSESQNEVPVVTMEGFGFPLIPIRTAATIYEIYAIVQNELIGEKNLWMNLANQCAIENEMLNDRLDAKQVIIDEERARVGRRDATIDRLGEKLLLKDQELEAATWAGHECAEEAGKVSVISWMLRLRWV